MFITVEQLLALTLFAFVLVRIPMCQLHTLMV